MVSNTEKYKDIIVPLIIKHLPTVKIILYGSRARGDAHEGSDIDIALDNKNKISEKIMSMIIGELEESLLPINYDIVDFHAVSEHMKKEIAKDGVIWKK